MLLPNLIRNKQKKVVASYRKPPNLSINNNARKLHLKSQIKMAKASGSNTASFCSLLLISTLLLASQFRGSEAEEAKPPVVKGLSWTFFEKSCPQLETIVRKHLKNVFKVDNGQAPALLRIFFHDCFVQGCDGSVLLDGNPGERDQPANGGIRAEALKTIDVLRALVHKECGRIVSCADLTAIAARDAVFLVFS